MTVLRCALVQCHGTYINITWETLENPDHVASVSGPWESAKGPEGFLDAANHCEQIPLGSCLSSGSPEACRGLGMMLGRPGYVLPFLSAPSSHKC